MKTTTLRIGIVPEELPPPPAAEEVTALPPTLSQALVSMTAVPEWDVLAGQDPSRVEPIVTPSITGWIDRQTTIC